LEFVDGTEFVSVLVAVEGNVLEWDDSLDFSGSGVSVEDGGLIGVYNDEFV